MSEMGPDRMLCALKPATSTCSAGRVLGFMIYKVGRFEIWNLEFQASVLEDIMAAKLYTLAIEN